MRSIYIVAGLACLNGLAFAQLPAVSLNQELAVARSGSIAHQFMGRTFFESDNLTAWTRELTNDARQMSEQLGLIPLINEYLSCNH